MFNYFGIYKHYRISSERKLKGLSYISVYTNDNLRIMFNYFGIYKHYRISLGGN